MLDIFLTIDIDADFFDSSFQNPAVSDEAPAWKGLELGVPLIIELFKQYKSSDGTDCVATWFVRADNQIAHYFGSHAFLFKQFRKQWSELAQHGHEIAWHPHLYRFENERWFQEHDAVLLKEQLFLSKESISGEGWDDIRSSRIGEAYCSNSILADLTELGISFDSSALPGRIRIDSERSIDWGDTPATPYFPSQADYRIAGSPSCSILEIPFSMASVNAEYDTAPLKRYIDLSFWHNSLKQGLEELIVDDSILNTIIHPSTVLTELSSRRHGLLSFSIQEVKKNIDFIIDIAQKKGLSYRFKTISQINR